MKLSVIIVNYNLCGLLRQNLISLINAGKGIDYEIFVVDNASTDKSVEMISNEFPGVQLIANAAQEGLAKVYNEAIKMAGGTYVLLVNPATISGKETFKRVLEFMDAHTDTCGLGVRMLSPQGRFLPESNRGLTKPWVAFLRLIGFAKNLPKTRLNDRGRKTWVEEFQTSEVDIVNGTYLLLRKSVLNTIGLFDERFTQYGYDIDLCYRARLAGYKNYYFPKTYIINYKLEETTKLSWHYIKYFYGAMLIFATKYLFRMPEIKVSGVPQLYTTGLEME